MKAAQLSALLRSGKKVVCIGKNYNDHITELAHLNPTVWDATREVRPVVFMKPTTSLAFPGEPLVIPRHDVGAIHHEVELAVLIGRRAKDVCIEDDEALLAEYVAGYCVAIDVTARDEQTEVKKKGLPWCIPKGYDTFCPVSEPFDATGLGDRWRQFRLWLDVNGVRRQTGEAGVMLHSIPHLIRFCSAAITLEPGDLLLTGTPAGVGPVCAGDTIEAGIEGHCSITVKVVKQPPL
eukprot:GGOE01036247.1.p1 GENE.GGOE01036247.1~~GGOE01036247.1.p1  ORF type:complete len:262 (+),score=78.33 GGOE01036247.1:79-786(+)